MIELPVREVAELKSLSVADLERIAQRLLPVPEEMRHRFPRDSAGYAFCHVVDARCDRRRGKLAHELAPPWNFNFPFLHTLARLIVRKQRHEAAAEAKRRRRKLAADYRSSGEYFFGTAEERRRAERRIKRQANRTTPPRNEGTTGPPSRESLPGGASSGGRRLTPQFYGFTGGWTAGRSTSSCGSRILHIKFH